MKRRKRNKARNIQIVTNASDDTVRPGDTYRLNVDANLDVPGAQVSFARQVNFFWDGFTLRQVA